MTVLVLQLATRCGIEVALAPDSAGPSCAQPAWVSACSLHVFAKPARLTCEWALACWQHGASYSEKGTGNDVGLVTLHFCIAALEKGQPSDLARMDDLLMRKPANYGLASLVTELGNQQGVGYSILISDRALALAKHASLAASHGVELKVD